jgi:hypothetical protein
VVDTDREGEELMEGLLLSREEADVDCEKESDTLAVLHPVEDTELVEERLEVRVADTHREIELDGEEHEEANELGLEEGQKVRESDPVELVEREKLGEDVKDVEVVKERAVKLDAADPDEVMDALAVAELHAESDRLGLRVCEPEVVEVDVAPVLPVAVWQGDPDSDPLVDEVVLAVVVTVCDLDCELEGDMQ